MAKDTFERFDLHGAALAYRLVGRGPALVLIHGMASDAQTWRHVVPKLARHFTVLAVDLPGHGRSDPPQTDHTLGAFASSVRDLMRALSLRGGTMVGHSYGGGVAMQFAYQYPELCERLVLVGSGGLGREVNGVLRALSLPGSGIALALGCRQLFGAATASAIEWLEALGLGPHPSTVEVVRAYASLTDANARATLLRTLRFVIDHRGQSVNAGALLYLLSRIPTQIMWGEKDDVIPVQHARATHAELPGSRLALFEDSRHYPHCDDPARFVKVLRTFVAETQPANADPLSVRRASIGA